MNTPPGVLPQQIKGHKEDEGLDPMKANAALGI